MIRLESSSAGEEVEDEDDDGEDEKDVDPATQGVAADQSYDPKDEEDNSDCPKHFCWSPQGNSAFVSAGYNRLHALCVPCCKVRDMGCGLPVRIK